MQIGSLHPAWRARRVLTRATLLATASLAAASCLPPRPGTSSPRLSERDKVIHLLSRATFGVRSADVDDMMRVGREEWLEQQLQPERIEDAALETRIASRPTQSEQSLVVSRMARPAPVGPAPMPNAVRPDVANRVLIEAVERAGQLLDATNQQLQSARRQLAAAQELANRQGADAARALLEAARVEFESAQQRSAELERQFESLRRQLSAASGQAPDMAPSRPDVVRVIAASPTQALNTLVGLKLERAVYSRRQLQEVMTDFWFNHFNVYYNKGQVRLVVGDYEQSAIRPNVFGRFEDMLIAAARHPAMLVYLDNFMSTAPSTQQAGNAARVGRQRGGLNENYARELLELHTLGVDGGYTQQDVVEVARAFTGWGIANRTSNRPAASGEGNAPARAAVEFRFNEGAHAAGDKVVLGQSIAGGRGMEEGLEILALLARHPSTARHIATKLVSHFVSDEPPAGLVDELARVFLETDGDLAAVTRALFLSDEFYDPSYYRSKVKRPFEFVASALRVVGAEVQPQGQGLVPQLRAFRHLPYAEAAPTGYATTAEDWVSGGAMLARMNFALDLVGERLPGISLSEEGAPAGILSTELQAPALPVGGADRDAATASGAESGTTEAGVGRAIDVEFQRSISALLGQIHFGVATEQLAALIAEDLTRTATSITNGTALRAPGTRARTPGRQPARITPLQRAVALALGAPEFQRY